MQFPPCRPSLHTQLLPNRIEAWVERALPGGMIGWAPHRSLGLGRSGRRARRSGRSRSVCGIVFAGIRLWHAYALLTPISPNTDGPLSRTGCTSSDASTPRMACEHGIGPDPHPDRARGASRPAWRRGRRPLLHRGDLGSFVHAAEARSRRRRRRVKRDGLFGDDERFATCSCTWTAARPGCEGRGSRPNWRGFAALGSPACTSRRPPIWRPAISRAH